MGEKRECPNCGGTGRAGDVPKAFGGGRIKTKCFMCLGSKVVDAWDYERLLKMVKHRDSIQMEMNFEEV